MINNEEKSDCDMKYKNMNKALLNLDEFCEYLGIGKTKARELLHDPKNKFTVRIGSRLYAHKKKLDEWLEYQVERR
ncbi:excisionase [Lacrimispora sp. 38-1]|uniref:excisionase n=1 Tax=Lacrimispora sp. 38-1 TaxID=3125778 RepID=UPI003CF306B8